MFTNREIAIGVWLVVALALFIVDRVLFNKKVRSSLFNLIKAFFNDKIITVLLISMIFIEIIILLLAIMNFWNISFLKDTLLWFLGTGLILLFSINKSRNDKFYFKNIIKDNFKFIIFLEFIKNSKVFNLSTELILQPIVFILVISIQFIKKKSLKNNVNIFMSVFGLILLCVNLFYIFNGLNSFITIENLKAFLLPIILTTTFLLFLYFVVLYMNYEILNLKMYFLMKNKGIEKKKIKKLTFRKCLFNLRKVNSLLDNKIIYKTKDIKDFINSLSC